MGDRARRSADSPSPLPPGLNEKEYVGTGHRRARGGSPTLFSDYFHYQATPRLQLTVSETEQEQRTLHTRTDHYSATDRGVGLVAAAQLKLPDDDQGISGGALARINPWLSACDLAQSSTAPDLQVRNSRQNRSR